MANITVTVNGLAPDTEVTATVDNQQIRFHNYYLQGSHLTETVYVNGNQFTATMGSYAQDDFNGWRAGTGVTLISSSGRSATFQYNAGSTTGTIYAYFGIVE